MIPLTFFYGFLVAVKLFLERYSLGVQFLRCLKSRLNVEMLGKPACKAISVMDKSGSAKSSSATLILL